MKGIQIATIVLVVAAASATGFAQVVCKETDDRIVITRDGRHVLTYNKAAMVPAQVDLSFARSGFIHPISTPSGRVLTDGYPVPHHTHQHGLFFAWRSARFEGETLNFWEHGKETVRHVNVLEITNTEKVAGFRVELAHVSGTREILREVWTVSVASDTGHIDLTSEQRCATKSPITLERFKYGAMAIRGSRQWFADAQAFGARCTILTSEGLTQADGNHSRPNWVCMAGPIDGEPVSITLVPHPSNFRHPQHVRLHPDMPYFCFIPTAKAPFSMKPGESFVSRFRIVAADGKPNVAKLDAVQRTYAQSTYSD